MFPCTGCVRREPVGSAGMHRFLWDLTYPAPDVLDRDYPISAIYHDTPLYPLGATVLPGEYKVVLTVDGKSYTQTLELKWIRVSRPRPKICAVNSTSTARLPKLCTKTTKPCNKCAVCERK
jgi:hypothetical protein